MKRPLLLLLVCFTLSSCNLMRGIFARKEKPGGCPVGMNIGAEKILADDQKSIKALRKASRKNKTTLIGGNR